MTFLIPLFLFGLCLQNTPDPRVAPLLEKFRSEKAAERERAVEDLLQLGPTVIRDLKNARPQEKDPEVRARIDHVLVLFVARPVCDGLIPLLAPSDDRLAFVRWVRDPQLTDIRGNPIWNPETWIRDLARPAERLLVGDTKAVRWIDGKTLLLGSGVFVDAETGKPSVDRKPVNLGDYKNRTKLSPDLRRQVSAPPGASALSFILEAGETKTIPLGYPLYEERQGFLSWSPDGTRLMFDQTFFRKGNVPLYRIGVVELATGKLTYVGERDQCHYNWGLRNLEGTEYGENFWTPAGDRFVFVTGRGQGEAELMIANADGSGVRALTNDSKCKWCPVFDPAGRRLAYAAATWGGEDGSLRDGHIRVLDLLTGQEEHFKPPTKGICLSLTWSPDGIRLYYDWRTEGTPPGYSIFEAKPSSPVERPPGNAIVVKPELTKAEQVFAALGSENPSVITWGTERIQDVPFPQAVDGLKTALQTCRKLRNSHTTGEVIAAVGRINARELAPDVVAALEDPSSRHSVIRLLGRWKVEAAREPLRKIAQDAVEGKVELPKNIPMEAIEYVTGRQLEGGVYAAWALAILTEDSAWEDFRHFAASKQKDVRIVTIDLVAELRDPRSVPLLIGLLGDTEAHHLYRGGELGDAAAASLKKLTGESFGRDAARWTAWWNERGGKLPERR